MVAAFIIRRTKVSLADYNLLTYGRFGERGKDATSPRTRSKFGDWHTLKDNIDRSTVLEYRRPIPIQNRCVRLFPSNSIGQKAWLHMKKKWTLLHYKASHAIPLNLTFPHVQMVNSSHRANIAPARNAFLYTWREEYLARRSARDFLSLNFYRFLWMDLAGTCQWASSATLDCNLFSFELVSGWWWRRTMKVRFDLKCLLTVV